VLVFMISGFVYVVEILPICRVLDIIFHGCIYELMTCLFEVYAIFPLWYFIVEIFLHVDLRFMEDVTSIS